MIYIFPKTALTASEKVSSILLFTATAVDSSTGREVINSGSSLSSVVNFKDDLSLIPSNELFEMSLKELGSIWT